MTACPPQYYGTTASNITCCHWCGSLWPHTGTCPRVKEIEYHQNGLIKRVVFHDNG